MWSGYDFEAVGRLLRTLRMERGWSLRDVERESGVSRQTVMRAEKGRPPTPKNLEKLAAVYGVSSATLLLEGMGDLPEALVAAMDGGLITDATVEEMIRLRGAEDYLGRPCDMWDYQALLALMRRIPSL